MPIQIIPRPRHRQQAQENIAAGIGNLIGAGFQAYQQHQQKKANEQQYQEENEIYSQLTGRNLSKNPKTREMEIEYALRGQNEAQREERKYKTKAQEFAAKLAGEKEINNQLVSFADRLEENNPNSPLHKTIADIYRTELPLDQKTELVKSLTGVDPFKMDQQRRLQMDSVLKRYSQRIKELDADIKTARVGDRPALIEKKRALQNERDQLLDYRAMQGDFESEADVEDSDQVDNETESRIMFDPNNKEHRAKAQQLYKKFKDKEKVRKILAKEFEGL